MYIKCFNVNIHVRYYLLNCEQVMNVFSKYNSLLTLMQTCKQLFNMSCVMRKPAFCICENKDADQLRFNREADQRLCFRYTDSTILLLPKSEFQASSHLLLLYSPVCVGPGQKPQRPVF